MSIFEIISIVVTALFAIAVGLTFFFVVRGNVFKAVSEFVAIAELTGLDGPKKMAIVVASLTEKVPKFLRGIFTAERLEKIAQWIFDWMRKYAVAYNEAIANLEAAPEVEKELALEAATELITELFNLTLTALKDKAAEYGVPIEDRATKKEICEAIIMAILNKA